MILKDLQGTMTQNKEKVKTAMQQNCSKTLVNDYGYDITTMRNKS